MTCESYECPFYAVPSSNGDSPDPELSCLVSESVKQVRFAKGEILFSQDQPSCCVYAITSGVVKIFTVTPHGHEQIVGFANRHRLMVGLQSLSNDAYADSAIAETAVTACKIRKRSLLAAVVNDPEITFRLIAALNSQIAMSRALVRVAEHHGAAAKVAALIMLLCPAVEKGRVEYSLPLSRSEMGHLLGLSEETVCRQMAKMKRDGLFYAPRGRIEIQDWEGLKSVADEVAHVSA
jgi:CRP/FNR family transcriptional regulator